MAIFFKYSSSGNDFIVTEDEAFILKEELIKKYTKRKIGIGADGIIFLKKSNEFDFEMQIFNADGSEASMCANGARASLHYAYHFLGIKKEEIIFKTKNAVYKGRVKKNEVTLFMSELYDENKYDLSDLGEKTYYANTGVPHSVFLRDDLDTLDLKLLAPPLRFDQRFSNGSNINFYKILSPKCIAIRTYERGVEDETLSCGTGAMATALACFRLFSWTGEMKFSTKGGELSAFVSEDLKTLYLKGAVNLIYKGEI